MKLSKSTTIMINVVLVLMVALLVKSLITIPNYASTAPNKEYSFENISQGESVAQALNEKARGGWRLVFAFKHPQYDSYSIIFER